MSAALKQREPDRADIAAFVEALFCYADVGTYVSLRIFRQHPGGRTPPIVRGIRIDEAGLDAVVDSSVAAGGFAANAAEPLVFCPPIATFINETRATDDCLACGLAISVELDRGNTYEARKRLEDLLGPATVVVASGGTWIDPDTGEEFPKLHLHWRLSEPTRDPDEHAQLRQARRLACLLTGGDASAQSPVHPMRWPGSWHLKDTPRLARTIAINPSAEVHLRDALDALEEAADAAGITSPNPGMPYGGTNPLADPSLLQSAMAAIPNADEHWEAWNRLGMCLFRATDGIKAGLDIWTAWSAKSAVKFQGGACEERWAHFRRSPPTKLGAGTIFFHAKAAGWQDPRNRAPGGQVKNPFFDPWAELQPPPFPIDALPPVLRAFAEDRARIIGADPCAIAWAAISAASAALHGNIRLKMKRHDKWSVPPAIWVALVGRPSTKKTPIIAAAWEPLHRAQKADLDLWRQELAEWKATRKSDRDPEEPKPRRRLVSHDATMEALQEILGRQDRGIGVLRDELSGWIGSLEKYGGPRSSAADRAFFLQAFDGGPNVIDRIGRGTIAVNNLLVTICGGIQPERLRQFSDLTDDGLWQRFAPIIVAPSTLGRDEPAGPAVEEYSAAIDRILTVRGETRVELCNAAWELREEIERQVFRLEQNEVLGARFASFCGKLVGLWGRLCLVLNYLDPSPIASFIVPMKTAERATALLFQSVIPCAARVYAATGGAGADVEATRSVAGYILTKQKERVLASDLAHNVRACRGQPLDQVQRVVSPLVAGGWLTPEKDWNPFSWTVIAGVHEFFQAQRATETARRAAIRDVITGSLGNTISSAAEAE